MKIEIVHASRRPGWPLWAVLLVLLWSVLGLSLVWLSAYLHRPVQLCLLKRFTGVACPTCGFTRGVLSLLDGRITQAWLYNPLLFTILALFCAAVAVRIIWGRRVCIRLTSSERLVLWLMVGAMLIANWMYVIFHLG